MICQIEYVILLLEYKGGGTMDFLYKLYSNNYFGIGLFIVITVLAFAFLIILFFGKKDEKLRTKEKIQNEMGIDNLEESEPKEDLQLESLGSINEMPQMNNQMEQEEEKSVEKPEEEFDPFVTKNMVLNTDFISNENTNEETVPIEEKEKTNEVEEIFNSSPAIIVNDNINTDHKEPDVINEEEEDDFSIDAFIDKPELEVPVIEEKPEESDLFIKEDPDIERPKKVNLPNQFSSVYLSKEKEQDLEEIKDKEEISPIPLRSNYELPKPFDLPKLNQNSKEETESSNFMDLFTNPSTEEENEKKS